MRRILPLPLRGLAPGMHERTVDSVDLHVLLGKDVHGAFVVINHATEYERIELMVYSMLALAFIVLSVCASLAGAFIANRQLLDHADHVAYIRRPGGLATAGQRR